jgi:hypothetical protein
VISWRSIYPGRTPAPPVVPNGGERSRRPGPDVSTSLEAAPIGVRTVQHLTPDRLVGRVAFVTGAAGDIGGAIAMRVAADGATVVLSDLATTSDRLAATADACRAAGAPDVHLCPMDVTDEVAVAAAVSDVVARVGPPDAIVTSAGYQGPSSRCPATRSMICARCSR